MTGKAETSFEIGHKRFKKVIRHRFARRKPRMLRLWTFQPLDMWNALKSIGSLYVEPQYIDADYCICYEWMQKQMARRVTDYRGHFPWWAYYGEKPDLRSWYYYFPGGRGVCLELQLAKDRVLLSDYETWHLVMSRNYLYLCDAEEDAWQHEVTRQYSDAWPPPLTLKRRIEESWERVFDFEALKSGGLWSVDHIQACFERLELADVVTATELQAR